MEITGSIKEVKARTTVSGDVVRTLKLEIHGNSPGIYELLQKPLKMHFEVMP